MQEMDADDSVIKYDSEPFKIEYEFEGRKRFYVPDFLVYYVVDFNVDPKGYRKELQEIGPKTLKATHPRNIAKRKAAEEWCKDLGYIYRSISFQ